MPSKRRNSDASSVDYAPVFKKARTTPHTLDSLLALPHDELAAYALSLQTSASTKPTTETWTPEKIAERADKTRNLTVAAIKKQMKWQPSCKTGKTKWTHEGMVPHEDVFYALFDFEKPKKAWKQKKIARFEFEHSFPGCDASIRYGRLRLTGEEVRVNWDAEEKTFKLSGTYGL